MFNHIEYYMIYSFWLAIIINFVILVGMRIFYVLKNKKSLSESLLIILLPFSYGYLKANSSKNMFYQIYQILLVLLFFTTTFGFLFIIYTHFA